MVDVGSWQHRWWSWLSIMSSSAWWSPRVTSLLPPHQSCSHPTVAGPGVLCVSSNWCLLFISQGSALTHGNQCQKLEIGRFLTQGIQIIYHSERVIKCTTVGVSTAMQTIFITSKDVNLGTLWRGYYILMQNANCFASRLWLDRPMRRPGWEGQPTRLAHQSRHSDP